MPDKGIDVDFLADNFEISAEEAAALVAEDESEAWDLANKRMDRERSRAEFPEATPVPASADDAPVKDNGGLQKLVLGRRGQRLGSNSGPK